MVTCMPARLRSAAAIRMTRRSMAVELRLLWANISPTPQRPSKMPVPILSAHGWCFYQTAPTPIFRHGAMSGGLDRTEIRAAGSRQGPGAAELWAGQARPSIPQVPLRRGLRHARAGGGADARSAHHGHLNYTSRGTAPRWVSGATEGRGRAGHRTRGNGNPNHQPGFFALVPVVPATF
jgi:hypothetical protein